MLKAITLYEPWASLMAIGAKIQETRPRRTNHRGDICIHAAKKRMEAMSYDAKNAFIKRGEPLKFHYGCIIAVVDLWDDQPSERFFLAKFAAGCDTAIVMSDEERSFGCYSDGRRVYRTRNLRRLKTPIPCKGFQCVGWTVPPEVEKLVREQL